MEAFVFINCFFAMTEVVQNAARATEGVLGAYPTTGIYDIILKVAASDEKNLAGVIKRVQSIQGVGATLTSIIRGRVNGANANESESEENANHDHSRALIT